MPRSVDHDERRRHLGGAIERIVAEHGLDRVSVREVAGEAGVSAGTVQRYFPTKDDMIAFAARAVFRRWTTRATVVAPGSSVRAGLHSALRALTTAPTRPAEARVWLAFVARAAVTPAVATIHREAVEQAAAAIATALRQAEAAGELPPGTDVPRETAVLHTLVLGQLTLLASVDPDETSDPVSDYLERLFTPGSQRFTGCDDHR